MYVDFSDVDLGLVVSLPNWRLRRDHLNELPVRHEQWEY